MSDGKKVRVAVSQSGEVLGTMRDDLLEFWADSVGARVVEVPELVMPSVQECFDELTEYGIQRSGLKLLDEKGPAGGVLYEHVSGHRIEVLDGAEGRRVVRRPCLAERSRGVVMLDVARCVRVVMVSQRVSDAKDPAGALRDMLGSMPAGRAGVPVMLDRMVEVVDRFSGRSMWRQVRLVDDALPGLLDGSLDLLWSSNQWTAAGLFPDGRVVCFDVWGDRDGWPDVNELLGVDELRRHRAGLADVVEVLEARVRS